MYEPNNAQLCEDAALSLAAHLNAIPNAEAIDWNQLKPMLAKLLTTFGPMLLTALIALLSKTDPPTQPK